MTNPPDNPKPWQFGVSWILALVTALAFPLTTWQWVLLSEGDGLVLALAWCVTIGSLCGPLNVARVGTLQSFFHGYCFGVILGLTLFVVALLIVAWGYPAAAFTLVVGLLALLMIGVSTGLVFTIRWFRRYW